MVHGLYIALCTQHSKSSHLPSPYIWPTLPSATPHSLPIKKRKKDDFVKLNNVNKNLEDRI